MKIKKQLLFFSFFVLSPFVFLACDGDDKESLPPIDQTDITKKIAEGNLLTSYEKEGDQVRLTFESGTVLLDAAVVQDILFDPDNWNTRITFKGYPDAPLNIPTLGTKSDLSDQNIKLDPTGYAPLSALLTYTSPVESRLKIRIKSKHKEVEDITHTFAPYVYNHNVEIHGLYPDYRNLVYFSLLDKNGKERLTDSLYIQTASLQGKVILPTFKVKVSNPAKMEPGLTLVSYIGEQEIDTSRPFMIDAAGEIRWILLLKNHPQLKYFAACSGLKRLKNGNFMTAGLENGMIYELDMLGNVLKAWDILSKGYIFHRDIIEIPSGNFLVAVTKNNSFNLLGQACKYDYMIEVHRDNGSIVREWDFKESLDERRDAYTPLYKTDDWAHQNAIAYCEDDNTVIVSHRFQGMFKVDLSNNLQWILSPHKGWRTDRKGNQLINNCLTPLNASGQKITDPAVLNGEKADESFDWSWGGHCPVPLGKGRLFVFDNGYNRFYNNDANVSYSRAVEYRIDDKARTIQQVWEYGKERGKESYSPIVSSVQHLPKTDHVLYGSGAVGFLGHGTTAVGGADIVEVDYKTKEVVLDIRLEVPIFYAFHRVTRMSLYPNK